MLLYFVRHGDPVYNDEDDLTTIGTLQADAVKKRLGTFGLDKIFSSTAPRAYMTAKPTADMLKKKIVQLDWCSETHSWRDISIVGADGKRRWCFDEPAVIENLVSEEVRLLGDKWYDHPAFADTAYKDYMQFIKKEADAFLLSLGYRHCDEKKCYIAENPNEERVALFAHAGFGNAFLSTILDIPFPEFSVRTTMGHTGITVVEFKNRSEIVYPKMLQLSNDSHLFGERLPLKYQNKVYI